MPSLAAPWGICSASRRRKFLPSTCRRSRNSERPPVLTSICRIVRDWATTSWWRRVTNCSAWRRRIRTWYGYARTGWRILPSSISSSTMRRHWRRGSPFRISTAPCRRPGAHLMWTTSWIAAGSRRSTCRPMPPSGWIRKISSCGMCATALARWCRSLPLPRRSGALARRVSSVTTVCRPWRSSVKLHPARVPVMPWRLSSRWWNSCQKGWVSSGPGSPSRSARPVRRPLRSMPSLCWWCSSALPPSTRAGASPSRWCWWCRSGYWAPFWPRLCAGWRTMSTSRWACSQPSACRPRMPSWSSSSPRSFMTRGWGLVRQWWRRRVCVCVPYWWPPLPSSSAYCR